MSALLRDRVQLNAVLIVLIFLGVLLLSSQSAASYPAYLLGLAMLLGIRAWRDVFQQPYVWVLLGLVVYLILSTLWSTPFEMRAVATFSVRGLLLFLFVIAVAECQSVGPLRNWLGRALPLAASLAAIAAMVVFVASGEYQKGEQLKGLGQLDNSIIAALIFGAALIFVVDLMIAERSVLWKMIGGMCACLLAAAIYYCGSRNAWFSVSAGGGVYLLSHYFGDRRRFITGVASLGTIALALIGALVMNETTRALLLPRGDSYRPDIWASALDQVMAGNLWFGLGIGTSDQISAAGLLFDHPHSLYLSVLFQGGMIGFSLFIALICWTIKGLLDHFEAEAAKLAMGLFVVALTGYVLDGHELIDKASDTWLIFWLPVGICLGLKLYRPGSSLQAKGVS